jgi:hypothetical protein
LQQFTISSKVVFFSAKHGKFQQFTISLSKRDRHNQRSNNGSDKLK